MYEGAKVCHPGCGCWVPSLGGFCVPVLFFFGLSAGACRGLLGVRVWGSYLGSWWIVGDTRIGVGWRFCGGCGSPRLVSSACQ